MEWLEADPLPVECETCKEDCRSCDIAGKRWYLSELDELKLRKKGLERVVVRMQRQIKEIEEKIALLERSP